MAMPRITQDTLPGQGLGARSKVGLFRLRAILTTTLAAILALIFIWPFLCIVGATFNRIDAIINPLIPIPAKFSTQFYQLMFDEKYQIDKFVLNSVWVSVSTTILSALASTLSGYALAKLEAQIPPKIKQNCQKPPPPPPPLPPRLIRGRGYAGIGRPPRPPSPRGDWSGDIALQCDLGRAEVVVAGEKRENEKEEEEEKERS